MHTVRFAGCRLSARCITADLIPTSVVIHIESNLHYKPAYNARTLPFSLKSPNAVCINGRQSRLQSRTTLSDFRRESIPLPFAAFRKEISIGDLALIMKITKRSIIGLHEYKKIINRNRIHYFDGREFMVRTVNQNYARK